MKGRAGHPSLLLYEAGLQLLSRALPRPTRADWLGEWRAELWHVATSPASTHRTMMSFCEGALSDIFCLRSLGGMPGHRRGISPLAQVMLLLAAAGSAFTLSMSSAGVRHALRAPRPARDLVLISATGTGDAATPSLRLETVSAWQHRKQHLFSEFAFYQLTTKAVHLDTHHAREFTIARASANLLPLLDGLPLSAQRGTPGDKRPMLLLSESMWRAQFGARRGIVDQTVKVGLESVRIGGIVADDLAPGDGHVDAWLILPQSAPEGISSLARVVVVARLEPHAGAPQPRWQMSVPGPDGRADYACTVLFAAGSDLWRSFFWAIVVALLSLPALLPLRSGEYVTQRVSLSWRETLRRFLFCAVEVSAVLAIAYSTSLSVAYAIPWTHANTPIYLHLVITFLISLAGMHWALRDQSQRCPICLHKLCHPARVGEPSRNFLAWNGIELVCTDGHGFLHVPEIRTSWFDEPRWLMLDPSWKGLFPRSA